MVFGHRDYLLTTTPPRPHALMSPCLPASPLPRLIASLLFAICSLPLALSAQYFTVGTDPASIKWERIKSEHFRVIYPQGMDSTSRFIANALENNYTIATKGLESKPGKWPVIIHNRSIVSNAFTPYAPKRMDFLSTPPQDTYAQPWFDQLVLHEFRHSVQYGSVNRGFSKGLYFLFGQQVTAGVLGVFAPLWFIEGDAVVQETVLSQSGRGRSPSFEKGLRAQFLEKGIYSYDKAYNGSYRDYIPDWYELGYLLVGYTRLKHGIDAWSPVMERVGKYPFMVVPFSTALHKQTGKGKSRLYDEIADSLKLSWERQAEKITYTPYTRISPSPGKNFTHYNEAVFISDTLILADKKSIDDINRYVQVDFRGNEKVFVTPGAGSLDDALSITDGKICWADQSPDPRWSLQNYGVLKIYDTSSGKLSQRTFRSKYFAPVLSDDGSAIVAAESPAEGQYALLILDAETGKTIHRFTSSENYFYAQPNWSSDKSKVISVVMGRHGKSLVLADPATGRMRTVIPFSFQDIGDPTPYGRYILYRGAYSGIDNIYAADTLTGEIFQVTSARFGASGPVASPGGDKLVYSNYTAMGNELVWTPLDSTTWIPLNMVEDHSIKLYEPLSRQMDYVFDADSVAITHYASKRYPKGLNLFDFHSWAPISMDINNMNFSPGVTLFSQNLLGTSFTTLGYMYNLNEETGKYSLNYRYEGLYPAINLAADYGLRKSTYHDTLNYKYHELNIAGGLSVPLNWYARSWYMGVQPYVGYSYKLLQMEPGTELKFKQDRYNSLVYRFLFYTQLRQSTRDIIPKWGQTLQINFQNTPFDGDSANSIFASELTLYFPGLIRHHGFRVYGAYQNRVVNHYYYSDIINFPRGYSGIYVDRLFSGSVSYAFPVFYPDWNIGPIVYLKRLKGNIFYDYARSLNAAPIQTYQSIGLDLTVDLHLLRHFAPLEAGLRSIYFPGTGTFGFEFLYSMNLSGIY
jgi:hypothetical protein